MKMDTRQRHKQDKTPNEREKKKHTHKTNKPTNHSFTPTHSRSLISGGSFVLLLLVQLMDA